MVCPTVSVRCEIPAVTCQLNAKTYDGLSLRGPGISFETQVRLRLTLLVACSSRLDFSFFSSLAIPNSLLYSFYSLLPPLSKIACHVVGRSASRLWPPQSSIIPTLGRARDFGQTMGPEIKPF